MKKILLLLAVVVFGIDVNAQGDADVATAYATSSQDSCYVYATLMLQQTKKDYYIYINSGLKDILIDGPFLKEHHYNQWIAALNHLSVNDWELINISEQQITATTKIISYATLRKRISKKDMPLYYRSNGQ
jgi:hypothetical protein